MSRYLSHLLFVVDLVYLSASTWLVTTRTNVLLAVCGCTVTQPSRLVSQRRDFFSHGIKTKFIQTNDVRNPRVSKKQSSITTVILQHHVKSRGIWR